MWSNRELKLKSGKQTTAKIPIRQQPFSLNLSNKKDTNNAMFLANIPDRFRGLSINIWYEHTVQTVN